MSAAWDHVMAKFKYATEIEHESYANRFLEYIGKLYALKKKCENERLGTEQVIQMRTPQNDGDNNRNEKA